MQINWGWKPLLNIGESSERYPDIEKKIVNDSSYIRNLTVKLIEAERMVVVHSEERDGVGKRYIISLK